MDIQFYNSRNRSLEVFKPLDAHQIGLYSCGPTVYQYAHIGNLRAYVFADVLRRTLEYLGFASKHVMNITDVGHLVGDGDAGEDKLESSAKREGKTAWEIASFYTDAFLEDISMLNIQKPHIIARATAHIPEQIALIQTLEKKGYTYQIDDGIYFDTSKVDGYGPMTGQAIEDLQAGARMEENPQKRHPTDFALWKLSNVKGQKSKVGDAGHRQMEWDSPWGVGFPGWHIECSAMSTKYLSQPFDLHTGGVDHRSTHHPNEIAQSEAAADGTPLASYWLHNEFVMVDGGKMAKSLGNTYTLQDLTDRGYDPLAFRLLLLGTHYRKPVNFTWEALSGARHALENLRLLVRSLPASDGNTHEVYSPVATPGVKESEGVDNELEEQFRSLIANDLGIPQALALLWEVLKSDRPSQVKIMAVQHWDQIFCLDLASELGKSQEIPEEIMALAANRERARQTGDYSTADHLRRTIEEAGYTVRDTSDGPQLAPTDHPTEL